jgi:hypothetical protein
VFVLHELEEMTMAEIASALDVPGGTVASRLRRARVAFEGLSRRVQARQARRDERDERSEREERRRLGLLPLMAMAPERERLPLVHAWKLKAAAAIAMLAGGAVFLLVSRSTPTPIVFPSASPLAAPVTIVARVSPPPDAPPLSALAPLSPLVSASRRVARSARPLTIASPSASTPAAAVSSTPQPSALSAEIALVQQATQSLARRDPDEALSLLSTYDHRYPHGALAAEAGYLHVQALVANGDRGAAMELAARLLAADPHGILAPKLEAVIASEPVP